MGSQNCLSVSFSMLDLAFVRLCMAYSKEQSPGIQSSVFVLKDQVVTIKADLNHSFFVVALFRFPVNFIV